MDDTYRCILIEEANKIAKELGFETVDFCGDWEHSDIIRGHLRIAASVNLACREVSKSKVQERIISALEQLRTLVENDLVKLKGT